MCEFNWNLIFSTFSLFGFSAFIHLAFGTFIFFTLLQWILFLFIISGIFKGIILSLLLFLSLSLSFSLFHHISPLPFLLSSSTSSVHSLSALQLLLLLYEEYAYIYISGLHSSGALCLHCNGCQSFLFLKSNTYKTTYHLSPVFPLELDFHISISSIWTLHNDFYSVHDHPWQYYCNPSQLLIF